MALSLEAKDPLLGQPQFIIKLLCRIFGLMPRLLVHWSDYAACAYHLGKDSELMYAWGESWSWQKAAQFCVEKEPWDV